MRGVAVAFVVLAVAGCDTAGPGEGQLEIAWTVMLDGSVTTCEAVGVTRVEMRSTGVALPDGGIPLAFSDRWPCDDLGGVTGPLPAGDYLVVVSLLDANNEALLSEAEQATMVPRDEVHHVGVFTFAFGTDPSFEDCNVVGDEDGDGDADCDDSDCAADPDCDEPPVCGAPDVTIAMVYDSGGSGSPTGFKQSFVVLKNRSAAPYDLTGHSLQTAGLFLATWDRFDLPAESIPASGYYLIALGMAGSQGMDLPTPDEAYTTGFLSGLQLVVALMPDTTPLTACPTTAIDLFSADQAACAEGTTVPAPGTDDPAEWYARGGAGCADTNVNSADFTVAAIGTPPNSATPALPCTCP